MGSNWAIFGIIFWHDFVVDFPENIFGHFDAKLIPKGAPGAHFWGSFLVIFGIPLRKWKLSSRLHGSSIFEVQRGQLLANLWDFFEGVFKDPPRTPSEANFQGFGPNFEPHLGVILGSFLGHFFNWFFWCFSGAPRRPTTTCFCSPGGFKELLS